MLRAFIALSFTLLPSKQVLDLIHVVGGYAVSVKLLCL